MISRPVTTASRSGSFVFRLTRSASLAAAVVSTPASMGAQAQTNITSLYEPQEARRTLRRRSSRHLARATGAWMLLAVAIASGCAASGSTPPNLKGLSDFPPAGGGDVRGELDIAGRIAAIGTTPGGRVFLATMTGGLYTAPRLGADWNELVDSTKPRGERFFATNRVIGGLPEGIAFANEQRGIVWGVITGERTGIDSAFVYTTYDGGRQWTRRNVGPGFSLSSAEIRASGEFWVAGYRSQTLSGPLTTVVYRSRDFGETWTPVPAPDGDTPPSDFVMNDDATGVLATINNRLFITNDLGQTWQRVATPFDRRAYAKPADGDSWARIEQAKRLHGWLIVQQDGHLFRSRVDSIAWQSMDAERWQFLTIDRDRSTWCYLDAQSRLREADAEWHISEPLSPPLLAPLISAECRNRVLHGVDVEGRVYRVADGILRHEFPLTSTGDRRPITMERVQGKSHWGATDHALYGSNSRGRRWFRYPFTASTIKGIVPRTADEVLIWDGHGSNTRFNRKTGTTTPVASLEGRDVIEVVVSDSLWFAFGGRQYETAGRVEVAQTFFGGQFRGTREDGFVMLSRDAGATWHQIDEWPGAGVATIAVNADASRIVLASYLGAIRELRRRDGQYQATTLLTATARNRQSVPYVQVATAFHFVDVDTGFITGDIHHVGRRSFRTIDGGRSWTPISVDAFGYSGMLRNGRQLIAWDPHTLFHVRGASKTPIVAIASSSRESYQSIMAVTRIDANTLLAHVMTSRTQRVTRVLIDLRKGTTTSLD